MHEEKYHKTALVLAKTVTHRITWHLRETMTSLLNRADCLWLQLVLVVLPITCPGESNKGDKRKGEQRE